MSLFLGMGEKGVGEGGGGGGKCDIAISLFTEEGIGIVSPPTMTGGMGPY